MAVRIARFPGPSLRLVFDMAFPRHRLIGAIIGGLIASPWVLASGAAAFDPLRECGAEEIGGDRVRREVPAVRPALPGGNPSAAEGVYGLEQSAEMNVLERVHFNPLSEELTLVGRMETQLGSNSIPYLQHLAQLLESDNPEFTLTWTPASERRVDAFMARMERPEELKKLVEEVGTLTRGGSVAPSAHWLLAYLGLTPVDGRYPNLDGDEFSALILAKAGQRAAACVVLAAKGMRASEGKGEAARQNAYAAFIRALGLAPRPEERRICEQLDVVFGIEGRRVARAFDAAVGKGGAAALDACFSEFNGLRRGVVGRAIDKVFGGSQELVIPVAGVTELMGHLPEVVPNYRRLERDSRLARLVLEADYLGKSLINLQEHEAKDISGYLTEPAFNRAHPGKRSRNATQHLWFSFAGVEMSVTGNVLRLGTSKVRVNVREYDKAGRDLPVVSGGYGDLLTSLYPMFAQKYPVLHELREVGKLAAVADWIRKRSRGFRLPRQGRQTLTVPASLPGVVYLNLALVQRAGAANTTLSAVGGVSLAAPPAGGLLGKTELDRMFEQGGSMPAWKFSKSLPSASVGKVEIGKKSASVIALPGRGRPVPDGAKVLEAAWNSILTPEEKRGLRDGPDDRKPDPKKEFKACKLEPLSAAPERCPRDDIAAVRSEGKTLQGALDKANCAEPGRSAALTAAIRKHNVRVATNCLSTCTACQTCNECRVWFARRLEIAALSFDPHTATQHAQSGYDDCVLNVLPRLNGGRTFDCKDTCYAYRHYGTVRERSADTLKVMGATLIMAIRSPGTCTSPSP